MARKISLFLTLLLLSALLLSGCGGREPEKSSIVPAATETPAAESVSEPSPASETAPAEEGETAEAERQLSLGQFSGSTYTNSYAGFGCTLDGSWTFADAQQLQDLSDIASQLIDEADAEGVLDSANISTLTDMYAESADLFSSVNVVYSKMALSERLLYLTMDEEQMLDTAMGQVDQLVSVYESAGMSVSSVEKVKVNFLGEEHYGMKTVYDTQGVTCYMLQLFDPFKGSYMVTTTITSYLEDNTQAVADLFFPLEE